MNFAPEFLSAVAASNICSSYYDLCNKHPLRIDAPPAKSPFKEVLKAAVGRVQLTKLSGPGTVYQLDGLPDGVALNFIVQGRSTVETDFVVPYKETKEGGTFAILCNAALAHSGQALPTPPYPRPQFCSLDELLVIFQSFDGLVRNLASVGSRQV